MQMITIFYRHTSKNLDDHLVLFYFFIFFTKVTEFPSMIEITAQPVNLVFWDDIARVKREQMSQN